MMYLALAPRSSAVVGTIVELSEKIVSRTINDARNLAFDTLSIRTPWLGTLIEAAWSAPPLKL